VILPSELASAIDAKVLEAFREASNGRVERCLLVTSSPLGTALAEPCTLSLVSRRVLSGLSRRIQLPYATNLGFNGTSNGLRFG
jgi:hypothetical protein